MAEHTLRQAHHSMRIVKLKSVIAYWCIHVCFFVMRYILWHLLATARTASG